MSENNNATRADLRDRMKHLGANNHHQAIMLALINESAETLASSMESKAGDPPSEKAVMDALQYAFDSHERRIYGGLLPDEGAKKVAARGLSDSVYNALEAKRYIESMPTMAMSEEPRAAQLEQMKQLALRMGMCDAADAIQEKMNEQK